mgnify:FL=1|jgi:hypothetical protein
MESQEVLIKELFKRVTVDISQERKIKAISYEGFEYAVQHLMHIAYLNGQKDCITDVSTSMKGIIEEAFAV